MNLSALNLNDLGRKISSVSGDDREGHFLFQRLSVILQRYNAVLLHESFVQSLGNTSVQKEVKLHCGNSVQYNVVKYQSTNWYLNCFSVKGKGKCKARCLI